MVSGLRKNFDTIVDQDIAHVRTMLTIDQLIFIYQNKIVNFIYSAIDTVCDPATDVRVIISVDNDSIDKINIVIGTPFTRVYEHHRSGLVILDPSHGIFTCPVVCRVTFRSYSTQGNITDFVKHYKDYPM